MCDAIVALIGISIMSPNTYNTNGGWVVRKMKSKYANRIVVILPTIYQKDKLQYFSNKSTMMISKVDHGKFVNWVAIMYLQLVKELIRWKKCQKNKIEGITKREPKKDVCHSAIVQEVMFHKWFPLKIVEPQEKKKQVEQPKEDKRRRDGLKERFIKNKRCLIPTHIYPKKEKQLEIKRTRNAILMSQFDDDEDKETL